VSPRSGTQPLHATSLIKVKRCELLVENGPAKGTQAVVSDEILSVGSDPDCGLVLEDETVSARHCEFLIRPDGVLVRDLGSRNGVRVNDVRVIEALLERSAVLRIGNTRLKATLVDANLLVTQGSRYGTLYGKSASMRALFAQMPTLAGSSAPVLIQGETGTGKDMVAQALHQASGRADGPCIIFDCGAVAASVMEAELFGHEKGAFTGAASARPGLAEAAHGGTLIVDEIGELPLDLQPKLLRLVERNEIRRVGGTQSTRIDLRIIACTHRALRAEVKAGRFREDLYYRLSTLTVRLPALRERLDDIPGLVDLLLEERGASLRFEELGDHDREMLLAHRWPGNIRELRNVVERLVAFPTAGVAALLDNEPTARHAVVSSALPPLSTARQKAQDVFEENYVREALSRAKGSVTEAAKLAGVSRQFLQRLIKKHGLRSPPEA